MGYERYRRSDSEDGPVEIIRTGRQIRQTYPSVPEGETFRGTSIEDTGRKGEGKIRRRIIGGVRVDHILDQSQIRALDREIQQLKNKQATVYLENEYGHRVATRSNQWEQMSGEEKQQFVQDWLQANTGLKSGIPSAGHPSRRKARLNPNQVRQDARQKAIMYLRETALLDGQPRLHMLGQDILEGEKEGFQEETEGFWNYAESMVGINEYPLMHAGQSIYNYIYDHVIVPGWNGIYDQAMSGLLDAGLDFRDPDEKEITTFKGLGGTGRKRPEWDLSSPNQVRRSKIRSKVPHELGGKDIEGFLLERNPYNVDF